MEVIIGERLGKITIEPMEQAADEKIRITLNNRNEFKEYKNKNLPVGVSVSFDMSWNKRSSGNRYDSILGHILMIGCLFENIIVGLVIS